MPNKKKELTTAQRHAAFCLLFQSRIDTENNTLPRGIFKEVAIKFACDKSTMSRFWREIKDRAEEENKTLQDLLDNQEFFRSRAKERGRGKLYNREEVRMNIQKVAFKKRRTFRSLSVAIGVPPSTLHRMMKEEGLLKKHTSALKPTLTEENKVSRVLACIDEVFPVQGDDGGYKFKCLYDRVDVNEKWFHMTHDNESYLMTGPSYSGSGYDSDSEEENGPVRRVRYKRYITKVLFLCAQARPRFDPHRNAMWDGKIGMWPIGEMKPAQRTSTRRQAGTLVWHDTPVTKEVNRELLLEKVVPAIAEKWPRGEWASNATVIRIQQDGPNCHIREDDEEFNRVLQERGLGNKILVYIQPANSPDLNINDLGFFRALQSAYLEFAPSTAEEIIQYVERAYSGYGANKINNIWLTLMSVMNEIINNGGENDYKIPHMGKEKLARIGALPETISVTEAARPYLEAVEEV